MCPSVVVYAVDHIVAQSPARNNYVSYTLVCVHFIVCSMYVSSCSTLSLSSPSFSSPANSAIAHPILLARCSQGQRSPERIWGQQKEWLSIVEQTATDALWAVTYDYRQITYAPLVIRRLHYHRIYIYVIGSLNGAMCYRNAAAELFWAAFARNWLGRWRQLLRQ